MRSLNVNITRNLFQSAENFQSIRMHLRMSNAERPIFMDWLKSCETGIEDGYGSIDDRTSLKTIDISGVNASVGFDPFTTFRASSVAVNAFPVLSSLIRRATPNASPVIFEEMFGAVFDACSTVSVFPFRVKFPGISGRIVSLHRWAFLSAFAIVVEIPAGLKMK